MTNALLLLTSAPVGELAEQVLHEAAIRVGALAPGESRAAQLSTLVLGTGVQWLRAGNRPEDKDATLLGCDFTERGLRAGTERGLRALARAAPTRTHRYALVDLANYLRPKTWR
jgi:serine/threonine-protein kinase PknG